VHGLGLAGPEWHVVEVVDVPRLVAVVRGVEVEGLAVDLG
jgi:hypothetical protein